MARATCNRDLQQSGKVATDMMNNQDLKVGDKVRHTGRPEWGEGTVTLAHADSHNGKHCQRLTIRFDRAGAKTISTAFASLVPAEWTPVLTCVASEQSLGFEGDRKAVEERLVGMPETATDPFVTPARRLTATLELYRFTGSGASLLDWAAMQTGLKDPLTKFSRQELEQYFARFQMNLETHLRRLVKELRRQSPEVISEVEPKLGVAARQALRRADAGR